jgi:uncharacterized protein (DUF2147 family)
MTRNAAAFIAACALATSAATAAEDVDGVWRTETSKSGNFLEVEVGPCGKDPARRCGVIVGGGGERAARIVGREMISAMASDGKGGWEDGEIWAPDDDKTYAASMRRKGEALEVEGCVLVFCRKQQWTRLR